MTKKQIGEFIKKTRIAQNLTQQELAIKVDCRRQVIIEIENCQCDYGIGIIIRVMETLGYQLVPTVLSNDLTVFDFKHIEVAKIEDDPILQDLKKDRIIAQSKRKIKTK